MVVETSAGPPLNSTDGSPRTEIMRQADEVAKHPEVMKLLDLVPQAMVILNQDRRIIFANRRLLDLIGAKELKAVFGQRLGEVIGCENARRPPGGCGTTEACQICGANNAMLKAFECGLAENECLITSKGNDESKSLDLSICASSLNWGSCDFLLIVIKDISHQNRRRILERIFFHDILNSAGGIKNIAELLMLDTPEEQAELVEAIFQYSDQLVLEIQTQRQLLDAENNELEIEVHLIGSLDFLNKIIKRFERVKESEGKRIILEEAAARVEFLSDPVLLDRVLENLIRNALEASQPGETVLIGCEQEGKMVAFRVHNSAFIPQGIQTQVFKRSFSTKGPGRGLGAYGSRLLTEKYLKGSVCFTSDEEAGTTFRVRSPLDITSA